MKAPDKATLRKRTEELGLAIGLLTRLPLPQFENRTEATMASAFWAYPLAGALIGLAAAGVFWVAIAIGFSSLVAALLAIAMSVIASGGFHEDGLSDFWDGLGGGRTREDKLAIMRDSHIGAYGVLALLLTLGLQTALIIDLHHYAGLTTVICALIAVELTARGAIAIPAASLNPARQDGLGQSLNGLKSETLIMAVLIAIAIPAALLGLNGLILVAGGIAGAAVITMLAGYYLNGFTGDVLGATAVTAKLTAFAAIVFSVTP